MRRSDLAGAAHLQLADGVAQLHPHDAMFEAMLSGFQSQQLARGLRQRTIDGREQQVRAFLGFTNEYPWQWAAAQVDEWSATLTTERRLSPATIRGYQGGLRLFTEYLVDGRYGWAAACEGAFGPGAHPVPICHEWNTIAHLSHYEGDPEARPFTRGELQMFFDYADEQVERAASSGRKGALAAYRDATVYKVLYGWGLFSGVRRCAGDSSSRVRAAQRLLDERLPVATGVVQAAWPQMPGRRVAGPCAARR